MIPMAMVGMVMSLQSGRDLQRAFDGFDATINLCLQDGTYPVTCEVARGNLKFLGKYISRRINFF